MNDDKNVKAASRKLIIPKKKTALSLIMRKVALSLKPVMVQR